MSLPSFKYHPDPIATGAIVASNDVCCVCRQARGYRYTASVYCEREPDALCPWCIADGSAARELDATFSDDHSLCAAQLADAIVEVVTRRTPGFTSWQQEVWLAHCGDACAFLGDATRESVARLGGAELDALLLREGLREPEWRQLVSAYEPGGNPAVYHFRCLHCGISVLSLDYT